MGKLTITFDDSIDPALHSTVELWIAELCDWLELQPRSTGLDKATPRFESLAIHVLPTGVCKGLRSLATGKGWVRLMLCHGSHQYIHLVVPNQRQERIPAPSHEVAFKASNTYILNQSFERSSYSSDEFEPELHYQMQLRYLSQAAPDVAKQHKEKQAAAKYKQQLKDKRQLQLQRKQQQRKPWQPQPPAKPHYSAAPKLQPVVTTTTATAPPQPVPSETEAEVIERLKQMWASVSNSNSSTACEAKQGVAGD